MKIRSATSPAFTMAEVLIAVTVLSILLVAIATAFNASAMNYKENANITEVMSSARQALTRMTGLLRTGLPSSATEVAGKCSLMTAPKPPDNLEHDVSFVLNSSQHKLYYTDSTASTNNVLCDHVASITFTKTLMGAEVKSVIINMTITIGDVSETFSSAAVVRKNL